MKLRLLFAAGLLPLLGFSQLDITTLGQTFQITFDQTVSGVNNGQYNGNGFSSAATSGGLDSDGWRYTGATSPASVAFGGTANTVNASRGISDGTDGNLSSGSDANKAGFYAFNTSSLFSADYSMGWFSDGVALDPGEIVLKMTNTSGSTINVLRLAYEGKYLNEDNGSTQINVTYSTDDATYNTISGSPLDWATPAAFDGNPWQSSTYGAVIDGLSWASGADIYIKWTTSWVGTPSGLADILAIDDISVRAYSADYVWDGSSWSPSEPDDVLTTSTALVLPGTAAPIASTTSSTLLDLYIESGASAYIGTDLTVANKIFLNADASGYAQVMGDVVGTAVYQTYRTADAGKWFNMAIPVDATYDDVTGIEIQTVAASANTNLWYYDAADPATNTADGTWKHITDKTTAETEEAAYNLYGGDGTFFGSGPFIIEVEGALVEAPVTIPVTAQTVGRFNLVPNPFSSAIDWENVRVETENGEIGATYYIQDGDPNLGTVQFRTYTFNAGTGTNGATDDLAPGQAFYVVIDNTDDASIDFTESMRNVSNNQTLYKTAPAKGLVKFQATHSSLGYSDESIMLFDAAHDDNFQLSQDGAKMMNTKYPNIYTKSADARDLVFNGMADAFTTKDVDLYFQGDEAGIYNLDMVVDALPAEWTITLEDKLLGNFTDLRNSGYGFVHAVGASDDRFIVHFNQAGAVGLNELDAAEVFSFLSNQTLSVNLDDVKNANIIIVDVSGKEMARLDSQSGVAEFNTSDWAKGVYMVNVTANNKVIHQNKVVN